MIEAKTTAGIDATILSATSTGADGFGFTLAFNSIGWKAQNFLFNAVDALLGDPLISDGVRRRAAGRVERDASIGSTITAAGDVTVSAVNAAQLNATVSNAASSVASAMFGAKGKSIGGILASNKVSSGAYATIDDSTVTADGDVSVDASRRRRHLRERQARLLVGHDEQRRRERPPERDQQLRRRPTSSSSEGTRTLDFGDRVRLATTTARRSRHDRRPRPCRTSTSSTGDVVELARRTTARTG